jgi:hypothetical protein
MDRLDPSNAEVAESIRAMILSDNVSDDGSTEDETESHEDYVEAREDDLERAEDAKSDDDFCNEVDATDSYFIGKDKTKWDKAKCTTHIRRRWQNILTKLPGFTGHARNATTPFEAWNCFITDEILDNIFQLTNQYIHIIQAHFSRKRDAKLTEKIHTETFIGLLYLAGALRSKRQSLEELCGTDGDAIEKFRLVMNQRRFKFVIRCITIR